MYSFEMSPVSNSRFILIIIPQLSPFLFIVLGPYNCLVFSSSFSGHLFCHLFVSSWVLSRLSFKVPATKPGLLDISPPIPTYTTYTMYTTGICGTFKHVCFLTRFLIYGVQTIDCRTGQSESSSLASQLGSTLRLQEAKISLTYIENQENT